MVLYDCRSSSFLCAQSNWIYLEVIIVIVREGYRLQLRAASSKSMITGFLPRPWTLSPSAPAVSTTMLEPFARAACRNGTNRGNLPHDPARSSGRALGGLVESHFERHARLGVTADGRVAHPREIPEGGLGGGGEGELAQEEAEDDL